MSSSSFHGEQEYLVTTENSEIWDIYNKESAAVDASMQDSANKSIDVLLVFTGLFSAVLTALIIFVYQSPDSAGQSSGPQDLGPPQENTSSPTLAGVSGQKLKWVAALWMISLALSLADATFCILAKQWVRSTPIISGSPRFRARQRQRRQIQFQAWHVMAVINVLPILLHTAILLFFIGLVVMLWGGSTSVTIMVLLAVVAVIGCYVGSIWLSLVYPDCPFQHPITEQLKYWRTHRDKRKDKDLEGAGCNLYSIEIGSVAAEGLVDPDDELDALALLWLLENCPKRSAGYIAALKAIGGLPLQFTAFHTLRRMGVISFVLDEFRGCFTEDIKSRWRVQDSRCPETYCRGWLRLTRGTSEQWPRALFPLLSSMPDGVEKLAIVAGCANYNGRDGRLPALEAISGLLLAPDSLVEELLDAFVQNSVPQYSPPRPREALQKAATPILIRLLHVGEDMLHVGEDRLTSGLRQLLALSLSYITGYHERVNFNKLRQEGYTHLRFLSLIIYAIAEIIEAGAGVYGFEATEMDAIVEQFCRMVSLAATSEPGLAPERQSIRTVAFRTLTRLYAPCPSVCLGQAAISTLQKTVQMLRPNHDEVYQLLQLKNFSQRMPATLQWLQLLRHILSISDRDAAFASNVIEHDVLNAINSITLFDYTFIAAVSSEQLQIHYYHLKLGFEHYFCTLQQSHGPAEAMESIREHVLLPALHQLIEVRRNTVFLELFCLNEIAAMKAIFSLDCTQLDLYGIDIKLWLNIYRLAFADLCHLVGASCTSRPDADVEAESVRYLRDAVLQLLPILLKFTEDGDVEVTLFLNVVRYIDEFCPDEVDQKCRLDTISAAGQLQQRRATSDEDIYRRLSLTKLRNARRFLSAESCTPGQISEFLVQYRLDWILVDIRAINSEVQLFIGEGKELHLDILVAVNNCLTQLLRSTPLTPDIHELITSSVHCDAFLRLHLELLSWVWDPPLRSVLRRVSEQLMPPMLEHCRMCPESNGWKNIYHSMKSSMDSYRFRSHKSLAKLHRQIEQLRCTIVWPQNNSELNLITTPGTDNTQCLY